MQKIIISEKEAGQRFDKYLGKLMPFAPRSFFYKMLRKKNIVLNGKKAEGMEKLNYGDEIKLFLSEETILKFQKEHSKLVEKEIEKRDIMKTMDSNKKKISDRASESLYWKLVPEFSVVYEDDHVLIMNKPIGLLSQKAYSEDISLIEHMTAYLLQKGEITQQELETFHPGICNRLDRNTSGLIIGGKTIRGLQEMNALLKEHAIEKYYLTIISGNINSWMRAQGYLKKDVNHNRVRITKKPVEGSSYICTEYEPLAYSEGFTFLKVKLITGKSHQIRAHLKSMGYPIIGDGKYGDVRVNKEMKRRFSLTNHLLHAYEIQFPKLTGCLLGLSEQIVYARLTEEFLQITKKLFPEITTKIKNIL